MYLTQLKLLKGRDTAALLAQFNGSKYAEHQMLWDLAGRSAAAKRDFLYRADLDEDGLSVLVLSEAPLTNVAAPWMVKSKAYRPQFVEGQRLAFKLRASLTIDKARPGKVSHRQDLVMLKYIEADGAIPVAQLLQPAAQQWLGARAENAGFKLEEVQASNYASSTIRQKGHPFKVTSVDMEGTLVVSDPVSFLARQATGFGKTRFAGLGLLLVRPLYPDTSYKRISQPLSV